MTKGRWLAPLRPDPAASFRLYCLAHAGGGPSAFRDLAARLPGRVEPVGIRLPGRESRLAEPPFTELGPLVASLVEAIGPELAPPYGLLGSCSGALLALEVARRLRDEGLPGPGLLVVLSLEAPDAPRQPGSAAAEDALLRAEQLGGTSRAAVEDDEMSRLARLALEADFQVFDAYVLSAAPPLDAPISALVGRDDPHLAPADVLGWGAQTTAEFTLRLVAGSHFLLRTSPGAVAAAVAADVERAIG